MTDDRAEFTAARDAGLVKRHEQRLAREVVNDGNPLGKSPEEVERSNRWFRIAVALGKQDDYVEMLATERRLAALPLDQTERDAPDRKTGPRCPRCGSPRWVSVSLDEGWTRRAQCVPCGAYHSPVIGPGYKARNFRDPEAEHPDYRREETP